MKRIQLLVGGLIILSLSVLLLYIQSAEKPAKTSNKASVSRNEKISTKNKKEKARFTYTEDDTPDDINFSVSVASFGVDTQSFSEMEKGSELLIEGEVIESVNFELVEEQGDTTKYHPYKKQTVLVSNVLEGDPTLTGQTITLLERGGMLRDNNIGQQKKVGGPKTPNLSSSSSPPVELIVGGIPTLKAGEKFVGILMYFEAHEGIDFGYYQFVANYKSKFYYNEENDDYERRNERAPSEVSARKAFVSDAEDPVNKALSDFMKKSSSIEETQP